MTLAGVLKFFGWTFTVVPVIAFIGISFYVIRGAANDDPFIMALVILGITLFIIGVITLLLVYLSGFFEPSSTIGLLS